MQYRRVILPGLFWASVAYNMGIVTFTTGNIMDFFQVKELLAGALMSITLIGWCISSFLFGYFSDKLGRKKMIIIGTPIHVLSTGFMFLAPNYPTIFILRFFAGFGFGIILPVLNTIVSENAPTEIRGRLVVLLDSFWTYGWIFASLLSYVLLPHLGAHWRYYFLTSFLWLFLIPLSFKLPESKLFRRRKVRVREIMRYPHTYALWVVWFAMAFGYYGIFAWLPKLFADKFPLIASYQFVFLTYLFQIPGYMTSAYLVERIGRRYILFTFIGMTAVGSYIFVINHMILGSILISFFNLGAWGALYAFTPENYPTRIRGTATGLANTMGRLGGILGPLIPSIMASFHLTWYSTFLTFTLVLLVGAFLTLLVPETMGKPLED